MGDEQLETTATRGGEHINGDGDGDGERASWPTPVSPPGMPGPEAHDVEVARAMLAKEAGERALVASRPSGPGVSLGKAVQDEHISLTPRGSKHLASTP